MLLTKHLRFRMSGIQLFITGLGEKGTEQWKAGVAAIASLREVFVNEEVPHQVYTCNDPANRNNDIVDTLILQV